MKNPKPPKKHAVSYEETLNRIREMTEEISLINQAY